MENKEGERKHTRERETEMREMQAEGKIGAQICKVSAGYRNVVEENAFSKIIRNFSHRNFREIFAPSASTIFSEAKEGAKLYYLREIRAYRECWTRFVHA